MRMTWLALLGALGTLLVIFAPPAYAHDELVASTPANGATLPALPTHVTLFFEEPPVSGYTHVVVLGPGGAVLSSGAPVTRGAQVSVPVGARRGVTAGRYLIEYRIMSDDGHPVSGTIAFLVGGASPVARIASHRRATSSDSVALAAALGGAAVLVLGVAAVPLTRKRRRVRTG
jgi:methionine-rich copper-binding protein CopC